MQMRTQEKRASLGIADGWSRVETAVGLYALPASMGLLRVRGL